MINLIVSIIFLIVSSVLLLPLGKNPALAEATNLRAGNFVDAKNITQGDSSYRGPVNGSNGERLRFRATVINDGSVNAVNYEVKFNLASPTAPTAEVSAANAATINDSVSITPGGTSLNFISGSGKKYGPVCPSGCNVGDEIIGSGLNLGEVAPGATESYQVSIEADVVGGTPPIEIPVFRSGNIFDGGNRTDRLVDWQDPIPADPGEVIEFRVLVQNDGDETAQNVSVRVDFPGTPSLGLVSTAYVTSTNIGTVSDTTTVNVS